MFIFTLFLPAMYEIMSFNFVFWPVVFIFIIALIMTIYRSFK